METDRKEQFIRAVTSSVVELYPGAGLLPNFPTIADEPFSDLKAFLRATHYPGQVCRFWAKLPVDPQKEPIPTSIQALPKRFARHCIWFVNQQGQQEYRKVLSTFTTRLESRGFNAVIRHLKTLNDAGYDIQVCPTTLTCNIRKKCTAYECRWVVLESDKNTPAEQWAFLARHHQKITVAVWSGNRSLQMWWRIKTVSNKNALTNWRTIADYSKHNQEDRDDENLWGTLPDYTQQAEQLKKLATDEGLHIDAKVADNCATLVRCPGFRHSKSRQEATLEYLNDGRSNVLYCYQPGSAFQVRLTGINDYKPGKRDNIGETGYCYCSSFRLSEPLLEPLSGSFSSYSKSIEEPIESIEPIGHVEESISESFESLESFGKSSETVILSQPFIQTTQTIQTTQSTTTETIESTSFTPFIQTTETTESTKHVEPLHWTTDLDTYLRLKSDGIPRRHLRRSLHPAMMTAKRLFGWQRPRLQQEWREITSLHPGHIGCSVDAAVEDITEYSKHCGDFSFGLPLLKDLPETLPDWREGHCKALLERLGCPTRESQTAAAILRQGALAERPGLSWRISQGFCGDTSHGDASGCRQEALYRRTLVALPPRGSRMHTPSPDLA